VRSKLPSLSRKRGGRNSTCKHRQPATGHSPAHRDLCHISWKWGCPATRLRLGKGLADADRGLELARQERELEPTLAHPKLMRTHVGEEGLFSPRLHWCLSSSLLTFARKTDLLYTVSIPRVYCLRLVNRKSIVFARCDIRRSRFSVPCFERSKYGFASPPPSPPSWSA